MVDHSGTAVDQAGALSSTERLMVCVSAHPVSERLVRTGKRLAERLSLEWFVVYIETPDRLRFSASHSERVTATMRLAESLGARVLTLSGRTVPEGILRFAREQHITRLVIGRPARSRWMEMINGSIVDQILRGSRSIDIIVVSDESGPLDRVIPQSWRPRSPWTHYLQSTLLVALVTLLGIPIHFLIDPVNLVMIYLLAVVAAAMYLGRGPSMLASILSALAFDYFFTDPRLSLSINNSQYLITLFAMLGVSMVISSLAGMVRSQVESLRSREAQTSALYALSRELTGSLDLPTILQTLISHISQTLGRDVVILLPAENRLEMRAHSTDFRLSAEESQSAAWTFEHAHPAGRGTDTLPGLGVHFQPLITSRGRVGVLGVRPVLSGSPLRPDQIRLLEAYSSLAALAVERAQLADQASQAQILSAAEKLQTALLNSISHDLRTPLATITGVFSSLHETESPEGDRVEMDPATRLELIESGWEEAERLNRLVGNLLDMTRLESGALRLHKVEADIEEAIGSALARLKNRLQDHPVHTRVPPCCSIVQMDYMLIEQVLVNLVDNAVKYSRTGQPIEISVDKTGSELQVHVRDYGRGIPAEDLHRIFNKFYRVQQAKQVSGTGLGLSICKGIIEAHGGRIWAENHPEGGSVLSFTLPIESEALVQEASQDE